MTDPAPIDDFTDVAPARRHATIQDSLTAKTRLLPRVDHNGRPMPDDEPPSAVDVTKTDPPPAA